MLLTGKELNDSLVNAAQMVLASQFPGIKGFQDTNHGLVLSFSKVPDNCVQIFFIGEFYYVYIE